MEGPPEPAAKPNPKRRTVLVLLVAVALVAAGFVVYWEFIRPRTIAEVFAFDHFQAGTSVAVQGTITGIYRENTSSGPKVSLQLDNFSGCNVTELGLAFPGGQVWADPNATYSVGQTFQTTLHFESYAINGDPAVWAPELACPFPLGLTAIQRVDDAVSWFRGLRLVYNSTEPGGWLDYWVFTPNESRYNLSVLPVTLRKAAPVPKGNPMFPTGSAVDSASRWLTLAALEYIGGVGSSNMFPIVDQMSSLGAGTSANGSLRFVDENRDRMLDDGDRLDIRVPPSSVANSWDAYLVQIGGMFFGNASYVADQHLILNGPDGPLEPGFLGQPLTANLAWAGDQPGPPIQSSLRVTSLPFGAPPPTSSVTYQLDDLQGDRMFGGNLTDLPQMTATGLTFSYTDANADGRFDAGDLLTLTGAPNQSAYRLWLWSSGPAFGMAAWIIGYGIPLPTPSATFTVQGSDPWRITANVSAWSPELALNRTLRATLTENGNIVVANASLATGTIGTFANGTLSFADADRDGYLSTGDYFTLIGAPTASYELQVTVLFNERSPPVYL